MTRERSDRPIETPFPQKIELMIPARLETFPSNLKNWICEPKLNGVRSVIIIQNGNFRITVRGARRTNALRDVTNQFPEHAEGLGYLAKAVSNLILDGELICGNGKTHEDLAKVVSRTTSRRIFESRVNPSQYVAFDLLYFQDEDYRNLPLVTRINTLATLLPKQFRRRFNIRPNIVRRGKIIDFIIQEDEAGSEGVVFKRRQSLYLPTPANRWFKYIFPKGQ